MAVDANSPLGQALNIYDSLSTYYGNVSTFLSSGGAVPDMSGIISLNYDELHRYALAGKSLGSDFRTGSSIEAIHLAFCLARDAAFSTETKGQLYASGVGEAGGESSYYSNMSSFVSGVLTGVKSDGSQL